MEIKFKQYVIIPKKPKMSPGKIASQVAHSTFMALEKQRELNKHQIDIIDTWKNYGMCVIILQCKTTGQLMGISKYFEQWKIPHHLYIDEGLTEVEMGTPTSLATGVLSEDKFWILSELGLYK